LYPAALAREIRSPIGRALNIRQVDAGSCNGCEAEITALTNPYYDLERFAIHFVASPKHADMLLVTGPVTRNMAEAVRQTFEATRPPSSWLPLGLAGAAGVSSAAATPSPALSMTFCQLTVTFPAVPRLPPCL